MFQPFYCWPCLDSLFLRDYTPWVNDCGERDTGEVLLSLFLLLLGDFVGRAVLSLEPCRICGVRLILTIVFIGLFCPCCRICGARISPNRFWINAEHSRCGAPR